MNKKIGFVILASIGIIIGSSLDASAQTIPSSIKDNAKLWGNGQISDSGFINSLQWLIDNKMIPVPSSGQTPIPSWIKNNAKWWGDGQITDSEFVNSIQWLIQNKVMKSPIQGQSNAKRIGIFAPNPSKDLLAVLSKYLKPTDSVGASKTSILNMYPNVQRTLLFFSLTVLDDTIATAKANTLPITYLSYDPEANNGKYATPPDELADVVNNISNAGTIVHNAGFKYGWAAGTGNGYKILSIYQKVDWSKIDLMVLQMQGLTKNEPVFTDTVTKVATFAKSKNPNIIIMIQVNPSEVPPFDNTDHIVKMIKSVEPLIDGTNIVVNLGSTPAMIDDLISKLQK